jgi:translation initiation factor 3 subunit E
VYLHIATNKSLKKKKKVSNNAVSPYQQVIEKIKRLSFRSQMLAMNIEKKLNQNSRSEALNWATQDSAFY